jgi:hypothetical protein
MTQNNVMHSSPSVADKAAAISMPMRYPICRELKHVEAALNPARRHETLI